MLAEQLTNLVPHLDVLVNNAGLAAPARVITEDGIESNFAVNVLAPFLLTNLLMDLLRASPAARVVNLTGGDIPARLELDNLQAERSFDGLFSYSQTKLAMMAVMLEFARRVQGSNVTINVCYPGQASTAMTRGVTPEMLPGPMRLFYPLFRWLTRPDGGKSAARADLSGIRARSGRRQRKILRYPLQNGRLAERGAGTFHPSKIMGVRSFHGPIGYRLIADWKHR